MHNPRRSAPLLYQTNLRVWLTQGTARLGRPATLDDLEEGRLEQLAGQGFTWIWLLGAWRTGETGRRIARSIVALREASQRALPDLTEEDICGSCFAVAAYEIDPAIGGEAALRRLRDRLHRHGLKLMLDFVPNHTAIDHPWARARPKLYRRGSEADLARAPQNYMRVVTGEGPFALAHGRDPNYPAWTDTLQLDYARPETIEAMRGELLRICHLCDGLRCDMAMLLLPEVFERSWGERALPFWPEAIAETRRRHPGFTFLAEAYWDLEWTLLQQGFDYAYDKRLYDRLRGGAAEPVRLHLKADRAYQERLARFLENHDEERAAAAFPRERHGAAAAVTYLSPGLKFFQEGQIEGRRVRIPVQLCRAPEEPQDAQLAAFYTRLLTVVRSELVQAGCWRLLEAPADDLILWERSGPGARLLVAVNYGDEPARCTVPASGAGARGRLRVTDPWTGAQQDLGSDALAGAELALDLPGWAVRLIEIAPVE
jgi:glycosidase